MPEGRDFFYKETVFEGEVAKGSVVDLSYYRGEEALREICDVLDALSEIESKVAASKARTSHVDDIGRVLSEARREILRIGDLQADEQFRHK